MPAPSDKTRSLSLATLNLSIVVFLFSGPFPLTALIRPSLAYIYLGHSLTTIYQSSSICLIVVLASGWSVVQG